MSVGQGNVPKSGCPSKNRLCACTGACRDIEEYQYNSLTELLKQKHNTPVWIKPSMPKPKKDPLYKVDDTVIVTHDGKSKYASVIAQHYDSISECWLYVLGYKFPDGKQKILYDLYPESYLSKA